MRRTQEGRSPLWLFLPLFLVGCVGLLAAAMMATIALGIAASGGGALWGVYVAAPILVLAMIAAGTIATWHGRTMLGRGLFLPPSLLGFALLWLSTRW